MITELISVGTEILLGNIVNTNSAYLSEKCALLGLSVYYQDVVGDNEGRMRDVIRTALDRSDVVILTGGLGPTEDDITKEVTADLMGMPLKEDSHSRKLIDKYLCQHCKNASKVQHQKYDHDHLGNGFEFSPVVCSNDNSVLRCDQTETTDDKFPSDDNDHNPCRKLVNLDHADHGRAYQKLVCQRIHKFSKIGYQIIFSGKMTVKPVCHTCCDKNRKTDPAVCFSSPACQ